MTGALPRRIVLREVGPRDGLQNVAAFVPTEQKLEIIAKLAAAGLSEIEVTSFVSDKVIPQMTDAEAVMRNLAAGRRGCPPPVVFQVWGHSTLKDRPRKAI